MPEPAPASSGVPAGGDASADLAALRDLLLRPDLDRLADLESRLDDPLRHAAELAEVLPEAVRGAKAKALREAIEPVFEKAFEHSVRRNPRQLADAVYPVIGPAIRISIGAALREFAETLNQIVEKSVSLRSIQWRIEALATGKSFSEILLARSLLYSVEQVFLIHRRTGILLCHVEARGAVVKDADMVSGMLTAIQDFVSDSFTESGQNLETVDVGRFRMWIQYGPAALVVGAVGGTAPAELTGVFRNAVERIHELLYTELDSFRQGDVSVFAAAQPLLEACLLGQSAPGRKRGTWLLWAIPALMAIAIAGLVWRHETELGRWERYFESLKRRPGIVVTNVGKSGSTWIVEGLKDPLAPPPAADGVRFAWQPYLSLNTPYAAAREYEAARVLLERLPVRFDSGSSKLLASEAGRIDEAADAIADLLRSHPASRVAAVGHSDEVGSAETNGKLSLDRARRVAEALVAARPELAGKVDTIGVGNTQPLRRGASDWDKASNRSVSFKLTASQVLN